MSARPPQEFDLFGEAIPTYDTKTFTPQWFSEMRKLIDAGRICRERHAWLKSQDARWSKPTCERLDNGNVRATFWKGLT